MSKNGATRVLVTGAGGYIGSTLVPMLLEAGYTVRALDRFFFGRAHLPPHERLEVVVEDARRVAPAHLEGMDAVIDLVAISNDPSGELFQDATLQINRDARIQTARLAKAAGARRYVLPSSCSIYGFQGEGIVADETSPTNPLTTYARANEMAEQGVLPLADDDFCVVVLRQATVYGLSPAHAFRSRDQRHDLRRLEDRQAAPDARRQAVASERARAATPRAAQIFMLGADADKVNGQVFNVGSEHDT